MTPQPSEQPTRWHRYDGDHDCWAAGCDLAAPDQVASPAPLDARHLFERLAAYCNGDIEAQFQEDTGLLFDEALARLEGQPVAEEPA